MKSLTYIFPMLLMGAGLAGAAELLFRSGYEPGTQTGEEFIGHGTPDKKLSGTDSSTGVNWENFTSYVPFCNRFSFSFDGCTSNEDARATIVPDPDGRRGQVLHYQVDRETGGGVACRIENQFFFGDSFEKICLRYMYKLSENYQHVLTNNVDSWLLLSEMWSVGGVQDRASLLVSTERGEDYFVFKAVLRYIEDGPPYNTVWREENWDYKIPLGKWVEVVHFVKPGPAGTGRLYFKFDGIVVFDIQDQPIEWKGRNWHYWSGFKLYSGAPITDFLRENGTPAQCWYDDLEVWDDIPTEAEILASQTQHFWPDSVVSIRQTVPFPMDANNIRFYLPDGRPVGVRGFEQPRYPLWNSAE